MVAWWHFCALLSNSCALRERGLHFLSEKKMNQLPRTVPWTTYQELEQVRSWLYSDCPEEAQLGVDRVESHCEPDRGRAILTSVQIARSKHGLHAERYLCLC